MGQVTKNIWVNRGAKDCSGQSRTDRVMRNGVAMLHMTCDSCPLDWYTVDTSAQKASR